MSEIQRLQAIIERLVRRIEENQAIARRFHAFEFRLLEADRLPELLDLLVKQGPQHFDLEAVSLVLFDPEYEWEQLAELVNLKQWLPKVQVRHQQAFFDDLCATSRAPILGELDPLTLARLFSGAGEIGSTAIIPLYCKGQLQGSLHLGAKDPERFSADKATDFLEHLGAVLALCINHGLTQEHLRHEGRQDPLTQVGNRAAFEQDLEIELARAERSGQPLSCFFVDLDHFKQINDNYGHANGDLCLREVSRVLKLALRKTDILARFGGEEFVALLPACDASRAMETAERVREQIEGLTLETRAGQSMPLTVSIGVCSWEPKAYRIPLPELSEALLRQADAAMYRVKKAGRNGVRWQPLVVR